MKLTQSEEQAITKHILKLDSRGFLPAHALVRDMANKLLAERHQEPVGVNWPTNFIRRNAELKTRWSHALQLSTSFEQNFGDYQELA